MLSDNDLCAYRAEFENLLGESCVIQRLTTASDGQGGTTSSWIAAGTVLCAVAPIAGPRSQGDLGGGQVREVNARVVTLPAETDIRMADQIVVGGQTMEITDLRAPRTNEIVRRVEARIV